MPGLSLPPPRGPVITYQNSQLDVGHSEHRQAQGRSQELRQGPAQRLAKNRPLAHEAQLLGGLWARAVSDQRPCPAAPARPGPRGWPSP